MPSDDLSTLYGNPLSEFLMFLLDLIVFTARSIYFLLETLILTILPNRYRKLKVSANHIQIVDTLFKTHSVWIESKCKSITWIEV